MADGEEAKVAAESVVYDEDRRLRDELVLKGRAARRMGVAQTDVPPLLGDKQNSWVQGWRQEDAKLHEAKLRSRR